MRLAPSPIPTRTCVGCRTRRPQSELLRFQRRPDGEIVFSLRHAGGRSAYLCPSRRCYDDAIRRRALRRSLSGPRGLVVHVNSEELWPNIAPRVEREVTVVKRTTAEPTGGRLTELLALSQRLQGRNEGA